MPEQTGAGRSRPEQARAGRSRPEQAGAGRRQPSKAAKNSLNHQKPPQTVKNRPRSSSVVGSGDDDRAEAVAEERRGDGLGSVVGARAPHRSCATWGHFVVSFCVLFCGVILRVHFVWLICGVILWCNFVRSFCAVILLRYALIFYGFPVFCIDLGSLGCVLH